jgi:hypothetical protein
MSRIRPVTGLLILAALLAAVFFLSLPGKTLWHRVLLDSGHGPVFAAIAVVLLLMWSPAGEGGVHRSRDYLRTFVVALALGIGTELVQFLQPNRSVSASDVLHDAAGAALGLALVAISRIGCAGRRSAAASPDPALRPATLAAVVLVAITVLAWTPLQCARAYAERRASFPQLAPAGRVADAQFIRPHGAMLAPASLPAQWAQPGDREALRLSFAAGSRPALEVFEPAPDWRGYAMLALDVTNPGPAPASFILRVLDARHDWSHEDRLNLPVVIPAGTRTTVRVALQAVAEAPARRPMQMDSIANLMLFATAPLSGEAFYVSRIWLE